MDVAETPRFEPEEYDAALNVAAKELVKNRYVPHRGNPNEFFEGIQKVRDELYTLVKQGADMKFTVISPNMTWNVNPNLLTDNTTPTNYMYILGVAVELNLGGANRHIAECSPLTFDEYRTIWKNPFKRPKNSYPYNFFYYQHSDGLSIMRPTGATATKVYMDYIKAPATISHGTLYQANENFTSSGQNVMAPENTQIRNTTTNAVTTIQKNAIVNVASGTYTILEGELFIGYTDTDLPATIHEELCKLAADSLMVDVENYNKFTVKKQKDQADMYM
jgi:hypothetical protein